MFLIMAEAKAFRGRPLDVCGRLFADGQSRRALVIPASGGELELRECRNAFDRVRQTINCKGWGDQMRGFVGGLLHSRRFPSSAWSALLRALLAVLIAASATQAAAQNPDQVAAEAGEEENNGTDPTRPAASALVSQEHFDLRGGANTDTLSIEYTQPLSSAITLRVKVPLVSNDVFGDASVGVGDIGVRLGHVITRTPQYGWVVNAELVFDTADGTGRGTGQNVLKTGLVYARFLKDGHIFAPAVVHSLSLWGENGRADVNSTTIDFYFVPRLSNRNYYMTIDPAVVFNWEGDKQYGALAVTMGRRLGPMMGGRGQIFFKPSINFGAERPGNWGVMVGFQLIGF